ncbi:HNH endonuclease [Nocardia sp. NPDC004711]
MRRLTKGPKPSILERNEHKWTEEYKKAVADSVKNKPSRWRHREVKAALRIETDNRCVYCDSEMAAVYPGDVEHLAPKSIFPELVVDWKNLTLACWECNNTKLDYHSESLPLINPYEDDPRDHFLFLGPMILPRPGSNRGVISVRKLNLSRLDLVERRRDRIESVHSLLTSLAAASEPELKETLRDIIIEDYEKGPYKATVHGLLVTAGILTNDVPIG